MNVENSNQFGKIDKSKLKTFESDIKAMLPNDYKTFLVEHNGGKPLPDYFNISSEKKDISRLHHCFGLHSGPVYQRIDHSYNIQTIPQYFEDHKD